MNTNSSIVESVRSRRASYQAILKDPRLAWICVCYHVITKQGEGAGRPVGEFLGVEVICDEGEEAETWVGAMITICGLVCIVVGLACVCVVIGASYRMWDGLLSLMNHSAASLAFIISVVFSLAALIFFSFGFYFLAKKLGEITSIMEAGLEAQLKARWQTESFIPDIERFIQLSGPSGDLMLKKHEVSANFHLLRSSVEEVDLTKAPRRLRGLCRNELSARAFNLCLQEYYLKYEPSKCTMVPAQCTAGWELLETDCKVCRSFRAVTWTIQDLKAAAKQKVVQKYGFRSRAEETPTEIM